MKDDGAHDLDVEGAQAYRPARRLARHRERLRQQVVETLPLLQPAPEDGGLRPQSVIGQCGDLGIPGRYPRHSLLELPQFLAFAEAEDLVYNLDHRPCLSNRGVRRPSATHR